MRACRAQCILASSFASEGFGLLVASCARTLALAALCSATFGAAQEPEHVAEEIIVRGKSYGEFRLEVERAQDALFARFNDINSDDRFDIHCRAEPRVGSKLYERTCASNSWREQDANFGRDYVRELLGETGANPQQFRIEQLRMQARLEDEMRRLALEDPALRETVARLGEAMRAMAAATGSRTSWTLFREITPGAEGLPFDAEQMFEVRIGAAPWTHALTYSTFTIGQLTGNIRRLDLDCAEKTVRLEYQPDVEWTLPSGWSACLLRVQAKRGTSFRLYEFD